MTSDVDMTTSDTNMTPRQGNNGATSSLEYRRDISTSFPPRLECGTDSSTFHPPHLIICNLVVDDGISDIIFIVVDLFVLFLLPVLLQISLYYVIVRSLWRTSVALGNTNAASLGNAMVTRQQRHLVRMSVTILLLFVLSWAPWHAVRLALPSLRATGWQGDGSGVTAQQVTTMLACCNSWITPLTYSAFNGRLRQQIRRLFRCKTGSGSVVPDEHVTGRTGSAVDGPRDQPLPLRTQTRATIELEQER